MKKYCSLTKVGGSRGQQEFFWQMAGWPFFALLPVVAYGGLVIKRIMKKLLNKQQIIKVAKICKLPTDRMDSKEDKKGKSLTCQDVNCK